MDNLLEQVDEYIRKNGIPFRSVYVNSKYFPEYFNETISREIRKISTNDCIIDKEYMITYDDNDNICLIASTVNNKHKNAIKTRLLLSNDIKNIKISFPCTKMYWDKAFRRACSDKYLENERKEIERILKTTMPNITDGKSLEIVGRYMDVLVKRTAKELKERDTSFSKELNAKKEFNDAFSKITNYIDYLNKEFIESTKLDTITYTPAEPDKIGGETRNYALSGVGSEERKNFILSVEERKDVLEKIRPMYACLAQRSDTNEAGALCYLYSYGNGYYKMILEPYSGEGYTKVIAIHCEKEMSKELFNELSTKYLEYSNMETMEAQNIVRLGHTTIDTYNAAIGYALTGNSNLKISPYTKSNLDNMQVSEEYSYAL
jgi:hypothetical protein